MQHPLNAPEGDFVIENFSFGNGTTLPELRQHYSTLGQPQYDAVGNINNAVLLLHNTTGTSREWLAPELSEPLFGAGQPLPRSQFFVVMPDCIGFGRSSKPSDGLRARFPNYRYDDLVAAQHRLLTDHLRIGHLRLVLGLSMGGMLTWLWGEMFPDFVDALVPVACQPGPMSGRNWIQRRMAIEAIRNDPGWQGGDYKQQPTNYALTPIGAIFTQSVVRIQELAPTRAEADAFYRRMVENARKGDANDRLYQLEASMEYDPSAKLERIKARVLAINFADDELNPPQLGTLENAMAQLPAGRFTILPATASSRGHYSAQQAARWAPLLADFLRNQSQT